MDVDLEIAQGETVALVGPSGSGKSTLLACIGGLLRPDVGEVRYDAVPLSSLRVRQLRRNLGIVPQQVFLFDDTVSANIAQGVADPDPDAVIAAARAAGADAFVRTLPTAYETKVGPRGARLSGGQRQRLAIARALYGNPRILLLDEATSALDRLAEREVQACLDQALQGRTAVIVAHRLQTVRHADRIVVMDQGRIVEQGDHASLMARGGLYARLYGQEA